MNQLEAALRHAADDLTRLGTGLGLIGGFAVFRREPSRGSPVMSISPSRSDDDIAAEDLVRSLLTDGYRLLATIDHDVTDDSQLSALLLRTIHA